ncbi:MAG TPA: hypothetical protein VN451_02970 [Chitinophagaceae bacterium]|nr:hypothetical protein [Chitinophagaceae bacterium]
MGKTAFIFLAAPFISAMLLFSCVPQKKATSGKRDLAKLDSQLVKHNVNLIKLDEKRQQKDLLNEIDSAANSRIKRFIDKTGAEIDSLTRQNTIIIQGAEVNKSDWDKLRKALSITRTAEQRINQKISFLQDLINRNMVVKLDQDVLFEPGKYTVAPAVANVIGKFFEPVAKEIDIFTQKYPDFPLSLVITAKGYADATSIAEGTQLFKDLAESMKLSGRNPDANELNKELSVRRSQSVIELFEKYTKGRSISGESIKNILYLHEGKGETFPNPKITDYRIDDSRRRIVLLFWSVFPE